MNSTQIRDEIAKLEAQLCHYEADFDDPTVICEVEQLIDRISGLRWMLGGQSE